MSAHDGYNNGDNQDSRANSNEGSNAKRRKKSTSSIEDDDDNNTPIFPFPTDNRKLAVGYSSLPFVSKDLFNVKNSAFVSPLRAPDGEDISEVENQADPHFALRRVYERSSNSLRRVVKPKGIAELRPKFYNSPQIPHEEAPENVWKGFKLTSAFSLGNIQNKTWPQGIGPFITAADIKKYNKCDDISELANPFAVYANATRPQVSTDAKTAVCNSPPRFPPRSPRIWGRQKGDSIQNPIVLDNSCLPRISGTADKHDAMKEVIDLEMLDFSPPRTPTHAQLRSHVDAVRCGIASPRSPRTPNAAGKYLYLGQPGDTPQHPIDLDREYDDMPALRTPSLVNSVTTQTTKTPHMPRDTLNKIGRSVAHSFVFDDYEGGVPLTGLENAALFGYESDNDTSISTVKASPKSWIGGSTERSQTSEVEMSSPSAKQKQEAMDEEVNDETDSEGTEKEETEEGKIRESKKLYVKKKAKAPTIMLKIRDEKNTGKLISLPTTIDQPYHILLHRISDAMGWEGLGTATMRLWFIKVNDLGQIVQGIQLGSENIEQALRTVEKKIDADLIFEVSLCSDDPPERWSLEDVKINYERTKEKWMLLKNFEAELDSRKETRGYFEGQSTY